MEVKDLPYITRILVPEKRSDILSRERLIDFLHERVECRLILVSAAAGYGKTTLLVDFAHSVQAPVCWYSMSEDDKDPKLFLEYLIASVRQRFPGFGQKALGLLDRVTDIGRDLSSVVGVLINEIHDYVPEYFFIVLDDYHYVDDSPLVNEALDLLLYYLPSNCHIIMSTRTLPKLTLSRLAAQRLVAGLGTTDLRFTVQEIKDFLRSSFKILLPDARAQELANESEGWITGIILSTYGLGQGMLETIMRARNSGGPLFDYMANEVFAQEPPEMQTFLLESSVLRNFNSERCSAVLGIGNARDMIKAVEEGNLFIVRTEGREWYQFHHLFEDYLRTKLKDEHPERFVELNARAGNICHERGELESAVQHFARAGRHEKVIEIIKTTGDSLLDSGKLRTVERWLAAVPPALIIEDPILLSLQGRLQSQISEVDKALESFNRAIEEFERRGDRRNLARTLAKRSTVYRMKGLRKEALADCLAMLGMSEDSELEAEARKGIGVIRGMEGDFDESIAELKRSLAIYEKLGSKYQMAELNNGLGTAYYFKGDLVAAYEYFRQSLDHWEKLGNLGLAASILNNLGMISYRWGDYDEALNTLRHALYKVREAGFMRMEAHILHSQGTVYRDIDDLDEALKTFEDGLDLARRANEAPLVAQILNEIGETYRLRGDLPKAERFIGQAYSQAEDQGDGRELAVYEVSLGLLAFDRGNLRQASRYLTRACNGLKAARVQMDLAKAQYYLANVYLTLNRYRDAEKQMRSIDQIVSALGCETYFLADIRRMPRPAEYSLSKGIGVNWISRMQQKAAPARIQSTVPTLSIQPKAEAPEESAQPVRVFALGGGAVFCGAREVTDTDWSTQTAKELFFYLISQPRGARREELLEAIWPQLTPARASSNFHSTLYRIRRATFPDLFVRQAGRYKVNPTVEVRFDAEEFESLVNRALGYGTNSDEAVPYWEKAAGLYKGPFLEEFYGEWCEAKRRSLEERYLQALGALARSSFKKGDYAASIANYEKIVVLDLYSEEFHRQLIKAYDMAGDRPAAIRQYNRLLQALRDELGTEPSPETVAIYNSLIGGSSGPNASRRDKGKDQGNDRLG